MRSMRFTPILLMVAIVAACDDDGGVDMTPDVVQAVSGDNQSGTVGQALANPISVRVVNANGNSLSGIRVEFEAEDGGSLLAASVGVLAGAASASALRVPVNTDVSGEASVIWTLGTGAGDQTATATVSTNGGEVQATFTATAEPDEADNVLIVSGNDQIGERGVALNPFVVEVVDQFGNSLAGETVDWAIANSNTGTLSDASSTTSADGLASSTLTPNASGEFRVTAGIAGVDPATFDAIGQAVHRDPGGDNGGATGGFNPHDLLTIRSWPEGENLVIVLEFAGPVEPAGVGSANEMVGFIDLDTDEDGATGTTANTDMAGGNTGMGMEFYIDMSENNAVFRVFDQNGTFVANATTTAFGGDVVTTVIARSSLGGDDGHVDLAAVIGTPNEVTDFAPNSGSLMTAPAELTRRWTQRP